MKKKLLLTQLAILSELFPFICNKHRFNQMKRYILICAAVLLGFVSAQAQEVTIGSKADWDAFAARVNAGETSLNASMIANVIEGVTTMVGTENNPYGGTFNGNGHTLTLALSGSGHFCAPFSRVSGATIENLKTTGTVAPSSISINNRYHASGLVGNNDGGFTARNCWVAADIVGSDYSGGLLGHGSNSPFTMENCLFSGSNNAMYNVGGLVGWCNNSTPTITNCLNAGTFSYSEFAPIARVGGRGTITNCYYTTSTSCSWSNNDSRGTFTDKTGNELAALLGNGWMVLEDEVVPAAFRAKATMKYGDAVPSLENLLPGSLQDVLSISTSATPYSPVGGYPIIAKGSGDNIYYIYGVLKIEKAPLKVTAKSYTIQQGDPLPTFEATYSGFKNKQTASVLTKQPVFTTISSSAVPGVYDIEVGDAEAENYELTYVKGKLTIEDIGCEAYANLVNDVLTFRFDAQRSTCAGRTYSLNTGETSPGWKNSLSGVKKVVFDTSFAQARPTSTYSWFDSADKLETIEGWENLNTSDVTNMANMFQKCRLVESLDLSGWNTGKVTNMANMFATCTKLGGLDLSTFDTQEVTNMTNMFSGCTSLTSLDLSGWNTKKVLRMNGMFASCSALTALDVKHFDTQNVTDLGRMFYNCKNLPKVTINTWNTQKVTTMKELFAGCSKMTSVNMQGMNMRKVKDMSLMFSGCSSLETVFLLDCETFAATDMNHMFSGCTSLTRLVLNSFDTYSVTDMSYMFANCTNLETINTGEFWDTESVSNSEGMFENCEKLVGAQGTVYNDGYTDKDYARLDGGDATPGYLSGAAEAYVVKNTETITLSDDYWGYTWEEDRDVLIFRYDENKNFQNGSVYELNAAGQDPEFKWDGYYKRIIDSSFQNYLPVSTRYWFSCEQIEGIEYLNTENVTDMSFMFGTDLTTLDLSAWDTSNVTDMSYMFLDSNLTTQDLSAWDTSNVTNMRYMFTHCSNLTTLDLSGWNIPSCCNCEQIFIDTGSLENLFLNKVTASTIESLCKEIILATGSEYPDLRPTPLKVVKLNDAQLPQSIAGLFSNYPNLTTIEMKGCDASFLMNLDAAFEGCTSLQGIDLSSLSQGQITSMNATFKDCTNLQTVIMPSSDNKNLTDMNSTFEGCTRLQNLDFSSFDLSHVTNTANMLSGCRRLQTIYCNQEVNATNSEGMFTDCLRLMGSEGTTLDDDHLDASYARVDGGNSAPGYFTAKAVPYVMMNDAQMTFYYDGQNFSRQENGFKKFAVLDSPLWSNDANLSFVKNVTFDASFADYQPTTTAGWFAGASTLKTITGLENLQTSSVESMKGMFEDCYSVTTLDLSGFSTDNVTDMTDLFKNCYSLSSLDMSEWTLSNTNPMESLRECPSLTTLTMNNVWMPTNMSGMFKDMSSLTTLNLSGSLTDAITDLSELFYGCSNLTNLNLTDCNTSNVVRMSGMFSGCTSLQRLDVSGWDLSNVTTTEDMFNGCSSLRRIICDDSWDASNVVTSTSMFAGCTSLIGSKGTIYDAAYTDKTYARIDGGNSAPGYLSDEEPGIATDIKSISRDAGHEGVYSLDGQKLNSKPTKKGVYIVNGRKVVVK